MKHMDIRPYHLVHLVAAAGRGETPAENVRLGEIAAAVRADPLLPLTLRCNVDSIFSYQNPGRAEDTPGGPDFNDRRDLHILQRLGLCPGDTRPAVTMIELVLKHISADDVRNMECEGAKEMHHWHEGAAISADFEQGRQRGLNAFVSWRTPEEKAATKKESAAKTISDANLHIRPHHLMCMSCFYGSHLNSGRPLAPIADDNLHEAIVAVQRNPQIPITLIAGTCDICPPCGHLHPPTKLCIGGTAMALRDQKKDLDVLQRLDLAYGDTLPTNELFRRLYAAIASTTEICGNGTGQATAHEWRVCGGPDGNPGYVTARAQNLGIPN